MIQKLSLAPYQRSHLGSIVLFVFWLLLVSKTFASERSIAIIPLAHAVPEQVVPIISNILSTDSSVNGFNNQVILHVLPMELQQVKTLLQQIDKEPRQLLISVRTPRVSQEQEQSMKAEGSFAKGKVQVGDSERSGRVTIRNNSRMEDSLGNITVQTTEGLSAYIAVGEERLIRTWKPEGPKPKEAVMAVQSADRGFYVVPRVLHDQRVVLEIQQTDEKFGSQTKQKKRVVTTVSGDLGEWIRIGELGMDTSTEEQGMVSRSSNAQQDIELIEIMVEML